MMSKENRQKREYEMAVKKSISLPGVMLDKAIDRQRQVGLTTFSDYMQALIRKDLQQQDLKLAA